MYELEQPPVSWSEQPETVVISGVTVIVRDVCTALLDNADKAWRP
jgi:hypothetical protein